MLGVEEKRKELADAIQANSKAKVDLWRRIPKLALLANGLRGWSDGAEYKLGISKILYKGYYSLTVDLATGEITAWDRPASVQDIISAVIPRPETIINYLENEIALGIHSSMNFEDYKENVARYSVDDLYVRVEPIPAPVLGWD